MGALPSRLSKAVDGLFIGVVVVVFFALHMLYFVLELLYVRSIVKPDCFLFVDPRCATTDVSYCVRVVG